MAHYEDLAPLTYFGSENAHILSAVGWLEPGHEYSWGNVDQEFFEKLCELLERPWAPVGCCGGQECGFCELSIGRPTHYCLKEGLPPIPEHSIENLFIPGDNTIYVSPELIAHYIDVHRYKPPPVFVESVLKCPRMSSKEYFGALIESGWILDYHSFDL